MTNAIELLEQKTGQRWEAIAAARQRTDALLERLCASLSDLSSADTSVVTTGSLGRGEVTEGSDADWVLLVDGPSKPDHGLLLREIGERIRTIIPKKPGPTGTFGDLVVSHSLVHYIAGTRDTNENLTRRILLLAESRALTNSEVRERVIRNVLRRYVVDDRPVPSRTGRRRTVPHFLLNDVVRYWRTIASDYASKMWERQKAGWGIRNIKLRFSRKLLFLWGLLASFSGELFAAPDTLPDVDSDEGFDRLAVLIQAQCEVTPLELLARVCLDVDASVGVDLFDSYDAFLEAMADPAMRATLENVQFEGAANDPTYDSLRESSRRFRSAVDTLFYEAHPRLPKLIREHGVF